MTKRVRDWKLHFLTKPSIRDTIIIIPLLPRTASIIISSPPSPRVPPTSTYSNHQHRRFLPFSFEAVGSVFSIPSSPRDITARSEFPPLPAKLELNMQRTLLLAPPSLSSHEERLNGVLEAHDRTATDIQMLDRLSLGLVSLPEATYDLILLLTDADGSRRESQNLMSRSIVALLVRALKASGKLRSQDGRFGAVEGLERTEAILAGLNYEVGQGFIKPDYGSQSSVPLSLAKKKGVGQAAGGLNGHMTESISLPLDGKRKSQSISSAAPAGLGFVDSSNDYGQAEVDDSGDEIIDEDTLLTEDDLKRPVQIRTFGSIYVHPP